MIPQSPGAGRISFSVSIDVTMEDIAKLPPDRIGEFFKGISEVMKVQAEIQAARRGAGDG